MAENEEAAGGSFRRLGKALRFTVGLGSQPESVIFTIEIQEATGASTTIEFFALPATAMALLQILEEVRRREGYPLPAGTITPKTFQ